jgi:hypothetical protein
LSIRPRESGAIRYARARARRDRQMENAIEISLNEPKKNPPARPQQPPYPGRVWKPP